MTTYKSVHNLSDRDLLLLEQHWQELWPSNIDLKMSQCQCSKPLTEFWRDLSFKVNFKVFLKKKYNKIFSFNFLTSHSILMDIFFFQRGMLVLVYCIYYETGKNTVNM